MFIKQETKPERKNLIAAKLCQISKQKSEIALFVIQGSTSFQPKCSETSGANQVELLLSELESLDPIRKNSCDEYMQHLNYNKRSEADLYE